MAKFMRKILLSTAMSLAFAEAPIILSAREPYNHDSSWVNRSRGNRSKTKCKQSVNKKREHKNRHKKGRP